MNLKNLGNDPGADNSVSVRPPGNFSLAREPSVYSLTFDEFMNTVGGSGKDFGSMNMDELLKNIWTAEEIQTMASTSGGQQGMGGPGAHLQKQGSLTLPRTLSQKTVDEVWKDISKDYGAVKGGSGSGGGNASASGAPNFPQRQQTLGEMTLEEFLVRAGVVREDTPLVVGNGKLNGGILADLYRAGAGNNSGLGIGFQQLGKSTGLTGNRIAGSNGQIAIQSSTNLPLNVNGVRSNHHSQPPPPPPPSSQQIFPISKPAIPNYATQIPLTNNAQLGNQGIRGGIVGLDQGLNGNLVQSSALQGGGMGMVGLVPGPVNVTTGSPANQLSCDEVGKSNGDTSSVSPIPYVFNGGFRGRKSGGAVEKVIERRQRRMIKNRESAARSRARKQAYTMELEAEVAKLKEENQELQRKQAEIMEMQKNQAMEMMNLQRGAKKRCLRRTQTGPW